VSVFVSDQKTTLNEHEKHVAAQTSRRALLLEFLVKVRHQVTLLPSANKADQREKDENGKPINTLDAINKAVKMLSVELRHEYPLITKPVEEITPEEIEKATNIKPDAFAGMVLKFPAKKQTASVDENHPSKSKRSRKKNA
jgi:hypothetical protein